MLNRSTRLLLYGGTLWYLGEGMLGPLFAVFADRIGGDILDITWAWAAYLIVMGLLYIVVGRYSDRHPTEERGKERLMVLGYALNAIFTFAYLLVGSPLELLLVQASLGAAAALSAPTWDALFSRHLDHEEGGFVWGLAGGYKYIVLGIALLIGGFIVTNFSFTALFLTMGSIQVVAALYQAQILWVKA